jgi:hypothetical protein
MLFVVAYGLSRDLVCGACFAVKGANTEATRRLVTPWRRCRSIGQGPDEESVCCVRCANEWTDRRTDGRCYLTRSRAAQLNS